MKKLILLLFIPIISFSQNEDILLNGSVSTEGNQIKNVADPTDDQDAVTLVFLMNKLSELQAQIDSLQSSENITDQDGNTYNYLTYGDQVWTVENANMVTYRDGTPIPQKLYGLGTEWESLTTGAWCYIDNDPTKERLYNWYAVAGIHDTDPNTPNKKLAPEGWHIPSNEEWQILENYLINNGYNYDGTTEGNKIAKAMASTTGWNSSINGGVPGNNQGINNSSGFNALPVGGLGNLGLSNPEGAISVFWCSEVYNRYLGFQQNYLMTGINPSWEGFSVRFVKDVVEPVNEVEVITTMIVTLVGDEDGSIVIMQIQDLDGGGPNDPVVTVSGPLSSATSYSGSIEWLNELEDPPEDFTMEILDEQDEHQVFFEIGDGLPIQVIYADEDSMGNPVGVNFILAPTQAGVTGSGSLTITLVYEPVKPNDGTVDSAGGSIDIQASFPVVVE
jgi:uncharacterized protein (TIGR02145 family)